MSGPTIHACAVLVGERALLIRGPSGVGKSQLALALLQSAGTATFARLVADDRTHVEAVNGRLVARPAPALAGLIEVRGLGIVRLPYEAAAVVGLVVDLGAAATRLPDEAAARTCIEGIALPRLAVAPGEPFPLAAVALTCLGSPQLRFPHLGFRHPCRAAGAGLAASQQTPEYRLRSALGWS